MPQAVQNALVVQELARAGFDRLASDWDGLVARRGRDEPFFRHRFLRTWLDNFAPNQPLRLFAVTENARLVAALPLLPDQRRIHGISVRRLRAPANVHSNRFDLVCEPGREDALQALWTFLRMKGGFDVIEIPDVSHDGVARKLLDLASRDGFSVETWESMRTPYIRLEEGFAPLMAKRGGHFRQNVRRRRRKLEKRGQVEVQRVEGGRDLERFLEEGLAVEQAGWKGQGRTAIACDPVTRGFYAEVAQQEALTGGLSLYFLRLQGRAIAFQLGLRSGRTYFLPKTSYDEELGDCSPGQLLMEEVLQDCAAQGLQEFDFLGPAMSWKHDWTEEARVHHWLYIFGNTARGAALRELKFRWAPWLKEVWRWKR